MIYVRMGINKRNKSDQRRRDQKGKGVKFYEKNIAAAARSGSSYGMFRK